MAANGVAAPWLGIGLLALGIGSATLALLGPLVAGVVRYHASAGAVRQVVGGDVAGLVLVAPVALVAGVLVLRGRRAGAALGLAPAGYVLYTATQLGIGGEVFRYPGNSERFFPLFLGLFLLAGAVLQAAWRALPADRLPAPARPLRLAIGTFALLVATFLLVGLHLPGLLDAWTAAPTSAEYRADPGLFWLVKWMDLGIVVPLAVVTAVGLLADRASLRKLAYAVVGWSALLGSSVAGMAIVMQVHGDPGASVANVAAFGAFAVVGIAAAVALYAPIVRAH